MSVTVVSFHAHPDDEALLTAGTLAGLAAAGHRVVLVTATDGGAGLAADAFGHGVDLGRRRLAELQASARAIGAARVEWLGYADSGLHGNEPDRIEPDPADATNDATNDPPGDSPAAGTWRRPTFVHASIEDAAARLAAILREESAAVLTSYEASGGYGHPDHVRAHHVGRRAAELAGTPVLLEATVDRDLFARGVRLAARLRLLPSGLAASLATAYTPRHELTHRIDVRRQVPAKQAALLAHASQTTGEEPAGGRRTVAVLGRLPGPLARLILGREWFVEVGRAPASPLLDDVMASLRPHP